MTDHHNVELRRLSTIAQGVAEEAVAGYPLSAKIHHSFADFHRKVTAWHDISERAYLNARTL